MSWMFKVEDSALIKEIERERDRAAGIIAAAYLEERLEELLRTVFDPHRDVVNQMFKGYGPLASFRAKIDLGHLLGLYPERVHKRLLLIKDVRNAFAHTAGATSFKTQRIADLCKNLTHLIPKAPKDVSDLVGKRLTPSQMKWILENDPKALFPVLEVTARFRKDTARNRYLLAIKQHLALFAILHRLAMLSRELDAHGAEPFWRWQWTSQKKSAPQPPQPPQTDSRKSKRRSRPPSTLRA